MYMENERTFDNSKYESTSNISNSTNDICRICHCEADTDNPLLSPCYCSGSLKYVHQLCLRQWLAASDTRSCELCKFSFILHTKIKPISEWRRLEMSSVERRRLLCAILFHFVAAVCVIWSLFVLIDRAAEEVQKGLIAWPFWTKLVVVAVGFTGGAVFMYIQCRQYLHLFSRWKAHNRIILVQNAPEKPLIAPPSPSSLIFMKNSPIREFNINSNNSMNSNNDLQLCYVFEKNNDEKTNYNYSNINNNSTSSGLSSQKNDDIKIEDISDSVSIDNFNESTRFDYRPQNNIKEILNLDTTVIINESTSSSKSASKTDITNSKKFVFKSLPNLNNTNSSENLLV